MPRTLHASRLSGILKIPALELGHAILLASVNRRPTELPLPPNAYESFLASRAARI